MATVAFDLAAVRDSSGGAELDTAAETKSYWSSEFHEPDSLLREEHWAPPVRQFLLPGAGNPSTVRLTHEAGTALLRLVEEVKMYANLQAQQTGVTGEEVLDTAEFWDAQMARIRSEWPASATRGPWLVALDALTVQLDKAVKSFGEAGAFLKMSARSPKDAVLRMSGYRGAVLSAIATLRGADNVVLGLSDEVRALKRASWAVMQVRSGTAALDLLLRSDRVYKDVICHQLFCSRGGQREHSFNLDIFVHGWFSRLDPEFEFRGFVKDGKRTGLSAYNPWIYNTSIHTQKARILEIIEGLWSEVDAKIPLEMRNYTIDFAVDPSLSGEAWVVELNNTLPPLAGSCLFQYNDSRDKRLLEEGPFEFRVLEVPWDPQAEYDAVKSREGKVVMLPASPDWLEFARLAGGREVFEDSLPWYMSTRETPVDTVAVPQVPMPAHWFDKVRRWMFG